MTTEVITGVDRPNKETEAEASTQSRESENSDIAYTFADSAKVFISWSRSLGSQEYQVRFLANLLREAVQSEPFSLLSGTSFGTFMLTAWDPSVSYALTSTDPDEFRESEIRRAETTLIAMFAGARDEIFDLGMDSRFSTELTKLVELMPYAAIEALDRVLKTPGWDVEVTTEALRQIGLIEQSGTKKLRLRLLFKYLSHHSIRVRDAACLGIDALEDRSAIPELRSALQSESSDSIKETISQVIKQLES
jgi:hypothetical protein